MGDGNDNFELLIFALPLLVLLVGLVVGRITELLHYKSIRRREKHWISIPAISGKSMGDPDSIENAELCVGAVVVSVDHFKRLMMAFRRIFGGEIRSYSSVIDRGRREAWLRMKEAHPNADAFVNCRLMTSTLSNGQNKSIGCMEVVAFGTAITYTKP